jgi:hypothetical protein
VLLSAAVEISEFLAINNSGLADKDGAHSDWVEIHNGTAADVNLDGYFLTDDREDLTKWRFPAVTVAAGGYLLVFASGKDLRTAGQELHANFSLSGDGDDLLLVGPGGAAADVLTRFAPFPQQLADVSYGTAVAEDVTPLIGPAAPARAVVPADGSLGADWLARDYDDTWWKSGTTGVGYDTVAPPPAVPGFTLKMVDVGPGGADASMDTIPEAAALLDGTADFSRYNVAFNGQQVVPLVNTGNGGSYGSDRPLPNGFGPADSSAPEREHYALRATASVVIPGGDWTINVNSDDGFRLKVPGVSFITRTNENTTGLGASPPDTLAFGPARGVGNTFATFTVPAAGLATTLQLDFFEKTGGDSLELSIAGGFQAAFSATTFSLLSNGVSGWSVTTSPPPPPDYRPLLGTDLLADMQGRNATAYVRVPFGVDESDGFDTLRLRIKYDDGFVAYLNGTEVARRNAPSTLAWNSAAAATHADAQALVFEDINLPLSALRDGSNVLAIHGLNDAATGDDFLVLPELHGIVTTESAERYFNPPTPGARNRDSGLMQVVSDTHFSRDRGYYDAPFDVVITNDTAGATIRYTTDGSAPTATSGTIYTGPVHVSTTTVLRAAAFKPGAIASNVDTQTYLFLGDVIHQPAAPAGFPAPGSPGMHWSYAMDPLVADGPAYGDEIIDDLKAIPSLSLVMNPADMFGANGLYMNPGGTGVAWERPGSAELFYADGTKQGFQIDAGVRIYGGVNRSTSFPKHTFRLLFKDRYGAGKLKYPLFNGIPGAEGATDEFDTLVLRGYFNKSWPFSSASERQMAQYLHDQFTSTTQLAMGQPSIHGMFVHLYVNGLYWGIYNPVERPSAPFAASYLGGDKDQYDALNSSEAIDGTKDAWNAMHAIANGIIPGGPWSATAPDPNALATPEAYERIKQYLDVDNLIDYMILNILEGNIDWDDHNWYAARRREPGAGFKFFSWDAERTLESVTQNRSGVNQADKPSRLFAQLRANPEFRLLFADHLQKHFFNDGVLTAAKNQERYRALADLIDEAIVGESARWGSYRRPGQPYTRDVEWVAERDRILNTYFPQRNAQVLNQFRALGLYPDVAAPTFNQHGGEVDEGFALSLTNPNAAGGTVYYTLDGSDPRLAGGAVAPGAVLWNGTPVELTQNTVARARVLLNGVWSPLTAATFSFNMAALRITEVMYNPPPPAAGSTFTPGAFEFVEVQNTGQRPLFVGGVKLREAVDFTFGNLTLQPGGRAVVVADPVAFQSRYGNAGITIAGTFTNALSDGGERVRLEGPRGQTILDFTYDDDWYPQTDGGGYSLVIIDPSGAPASWNDKRSWRPSNELNGGPGAADPGTNPGAVVVNELLALSPAPGGDFVELHNTTSQPVDLSGWFVSDVASNLRRYIIPGGTTIAADGYLLLDEATLGFGLAETGGQVLLSSVESLGNVGGYRESARFAGSLPGVSFGQHVKANGGTDFVALVAPTPGAANSPPLVGPVVISEVMYNPALGAGGEYIELRNLTGDAVPLAGWKFVDGIDYALPAGATIPAFDYALVAAAAPDVFRTQYVVPPAVPVFGPYSSNGTNVLDNGGENLTLYRPGPGSIGVLVDRVNYLDHAPWPPAADGTGPALARRDPFGYGNDPANWSADLSPGRLNFDTAAPVADVTNVVPDPRFAPVDAVTITFDEPVTGLTLAHLVLTRGGGGNMITGSQTLTTTDGVTWTLGNLAGLTTAPGTYTLAVNDSVPGVADYAGNALGDDATDVWTMASAPAVVGRHAFYNNSAADRRGGDDAAVAPDKQALLPGGAWSFSNVTSYTRGLNGVMIDVSGLPASFDPAVAFTFRAGAGGDPAAWPAAPAPLSITRRTGAGQNGSDRVTLLWSDGAIKNKWLQVTLLADANTALSAADVFYLGNLVGETGNVPGAARVDALDFALTRSHLRNVAAPDSPYDFNRDGRVDALDLNAVRGNLFKSLQSPAPVAPAASATVAYLPRGTYRPLAPKRLGVLSEAPDASY